MEVPAVVFREYDVRGLVGSQLTPQFAAAIGRAFATLVRRKTTRDDAAIVVGRDNRPSGELLSAAVRDGIALAGATAIDVGMIPTPALYYAVYDRGTAAGLQVTGSHNPPEFNGFKMLTAQEPVYGEAIQDIKRLIESDDTPVGGSGRLETDLTVLESYVGRLVELNGPLARPVKVAVDCGNGVASLVAVDLLTRLGAEVVPLFCESDGTFPNHHPDPTVIENLADLQEAVRRENAELGIAFDGDGDRIGAVDETGRVVYGDQLLVLFGRDLAERCGGGHSVIFDVKCSDVLFPELRSVGLQPVIWKTGHSLIKSKMKELTAPLAGEMSGHMFFGDDYYGFDDALFAACRLLAFISRRSGPLSRIMSDIPVGVTTPELRVNCADEDKFVIVQNAAAHFSRNYEVLTLDGARIRFDDGWGLIRASNTQPVIVLRFEASTSEALDRNRMIVEDWLRAQGVTLD